MDVEELACYLTGLNYEKIDADTKKIDESLKEKFGCDLYQFAQIIAQLLPMIDVGRSPLTGATYKGFADKKKGMWLAKIPVK